MKLQKVRSVIAKIANVLNCGAMIPLFVMVFIVAVDVILRKIKIGHIDGSNELTMYFMVWICMLGIPVLHAKDGHVWVNLFVNRLPYRLRCFWRCLIMACETAVVALLAWGGYEKTKFFFLRSTATDILDMPRWIFAAAAMLAFAEYFILSLIDTVGLCLDGINGEQKKAADEGWNDGQVKGI